MCVDLCDEYVYPEIAICSATCPYFINFIKNQKECWLTKCPNNKLHLPNKTCVDKCT